MAQTTIPVTNPPQETPPAADDKPVLRTLVPEEFHDRPYLKDLLEKPVAEAAPEVFKKLDHSQKLIGKKTGIPEVDAPAEEWAKFHASIRPETADAYELKFGEGADEAFIKATRSAFHEASLTKHQAVKLQETFIKGIEERQAKEAEVAKKLDAEFDQVMKSTFGDDNKKVLERVQGVLKEHTPENLRNHLPRLTNENLAILAGVINAVQKAYMPEDEIAGTGGSGSGGESVTDLRERGRKLMASEAYRDPLHAKHEETKKEVDELYARIAKMQKGS